MMTEEIIINAKEIEIVSGEGTGNGCIEDYDGKRTEKAICARLRKEECGGDRWAYVEIDGEKYTRSGNALEPRY